MCSSIAGKSREVRRGAVSKNSTTRSRRSASGSSQCFAAAVRH